MSQSTNDTEQDLLNCTLILAKALSLFLKDNEGIVVDVSDQVKFDNKTIKRVVVYNKDNEIKVFPADEDINANAIEGKMILMNPTFMLN